MIYILARKKKTKEVLSFVKFENRLKDRPDIIFKCFKTVINNLFCKNINFNMVYYEILEKNPFKNSVKI